VAATAGSLVAAVVATGRCSVCFVAAAVVVVVDMRVVAVATVVVIPTFAGSPVGKW
jgi:hypothetical protein